jgi:hypothetical protein
VAWDALVSFFHKGIATDAQDLPLQVDAEVEEAQHRLFAEAMVDRLYQRFGAFVPAPDVADGGHLALTAADEVGSATFRWDLSEALKVSRPLLLHLHPLEAARELVRNEGLDAVVSRTVVPPLQTGVLPLSIIANLPPHREGVLALGVTVEAPPKPPHRMQAIIETVELDPPDDTEELNLRFSPAEEPAYTVRTFAVLRDTTGIERLEGEERPHAGQQLRLTVADFPLCFIPLEASDRLLELARVQGTCHWQDEEETVEMPFTLDQDQPSFALVLPERAAEARLHIEATAREGENSLILNSLPAEAQQIGLYSFAEYGPHEITITCVFDDETTSFAVDLLPEAAPESQDEITVLAFEPQRSSRTWRWFAANPFRAGYRYRLNDSNDGGAGPWSEVCSPFASLTILVAEEEVIEDESEC